MSLLYTNTKNISIVEKNDYYQSMKSVDLIKLNQNENNARMTYKKDELRPAV